MVNMLAKSLVNMITKSLVNILAALLVDMSPESLWNILAELLASLLDNTMINIYLKANMQIYLMRYIKYDESGTITLKYFFKYSFSVFDLRAASWVYNFVVQV